MTIKLFNILLLFCFQVSFGQKSTITQYKIFGEIVGRDTGKIFLTSGFITDDYLPNTSVSSILKNGKFHINGKLRYPIAKRIVYKIDSNTNFLSGLFFINTGKQYITLFSDSVDIIPHSQGSLENKIYKQDYLDKLNSLKIEENEVDSAFENLYVKYNSNIPDYIKLKYDTIRVELLRKKNLELLSFTKTHSNSFIGIWLLVEAFCINGYMPLYDKIYDQLSKKIKNSYTGKILRDKLKIASKTSINYVFPAIALVDTNNNKINKNYSKGNKLILLDFWFTQCKPCIAQFPQLINIYEHYKSRGFDIINISVDKKPYLSNLKILIKRYNLFWKNYWDVDGIESSKLSITSFPTNFLLNEEGKIVAKNIEPEELEIFLKKHLY